MSKTTYLFLFFLVAICFSVSAITGRHTACMIYLAIMLCDIAAVFIGAYYSIRIEYYFFSPSRWDMKL